MAGAMAMEKCARTVGAGRQCKALFLFTRAEMRKGGVPNKISHNLKRKEFNSITDI